MRYSIGCVFVWRMNSGEKWAGRSRVIRKCEREEEKNEDENQRRAMEGASAESGETIMSKTNGKENENEEEAHLWQRMYQFYEKWMVMKGRVHIVVS